MIYFRGHEGVPAVQFQVEFERRLRSSAGEAVCPVEQYVEGGGGCLDCDLFWVCLVCFIRPGLRSSEFLV